MVAFLFADSNRVRIRYIKESDVAWGQTPASGRTRELRYTGSTLNVQKDTAISEEIRSDRMVPDIIETAMRSSGDMNIEFSAGSHDDFYEGFMYGAWTRPMTFDSVKGLSVVWFSTSVLYINGSDVSDYYTVGHRIRTDGFVNPANNNYFEIQGITFNSGANRTEITVTTTTSVAEAGTAFSGLWDANDVIVLRNTHIRSGTAGASSFDSNGNNAFAAAIAAGQLKTGQKIFVEGLGFETGTVTVSDPTSTAIAVGATLIVNDGVTIQTLQFGGQLLPGNVAVVASATDEDVTATNIAAAVNALRAQGKTKVSATSALGVVTFKNLNSTGGAITKAGDTNTALAIVAFSGGNVTVRGIYTVTSATDDVLGVSPAPATLANSTIPVSIKGSMLRNPSLAADIVPHSFSLEMAYDDINKFRIADGQRVSTFALNIAAGSILTGSFGLMGREIKAINATQLGNDADYTVLNTTATSVANATVNVGQIEMNGVPLSTALKTISLSANNNLRDQQAVGNKFPIGIGAGRIELTGSVEAYFANDDMWNQFINHETASLSFFVEDVDAHHYEFTIPAVVFSTDTENPAGGNQDIMETMDWTAKRDPVTECMLQIDRFSSVTPIAA
jgi:hypothetical protein